MSLVVDFVDSNDSSAGFLYALDNFSARAYYGSDHVFRDNHRFDTRRMRFQVGARFGDSVGDNIKNVQTTFAGLVQCFFQNFVRKSVALDIHLGRCDTVASSGHFEVHIPEVVFVTENIRENGIFHIVFIGNQSHSYARHRFLDFHTGIHKSQCPGTNRCHRGGTV